MKRQFSGIILFLAVFLFVYGWRVYGLVDIVMLISATAIGLAFILQIPLNKQILFVSALLGGTLAYTTGIAFFYGVPDIVLVGRAGRALLNFAGGAAFAYAYQRIYRQELLIAAVNHLFWAITLHGLLMIGMYFSQTFRMMIINLTGALQYVNKPDSVILGLRIPGLTYGLGTTSVLQMFGLMLLIPVWRSQRGVLRRLVLIVAALIIFVSVALAGRTGIVLTIALLPPLLLASAERLSLAGTLRTLRNGTVVIGLLALTAWASASMLDWEGDQLSYTVSHVEEVWVLLDEGESKTTDALGEMLVLPDSALGVLFGEAHLGRIAGNIVKSDIGFILGIYGVGLVGSTIMLTPYLYGIAYSCHMRRYYRPTSMAILFILLAVVITHIKQVGLYTRQLWSIQSLLICAYFLQLTDAKRAWEGVWAGKE